MSNTKITDKGNPYEKHTQMAEEQKKTKPKKKLEQLDEEVLKTFLILMKPKQDFTFGFGSIITHEE